MDLSQSSFYRQSANDSESVPKYQIIIPPQNCPNNMGGGFSSCISLIVIVVLICCFVYMYYSANKPMRFPRY